MTEEQQLKAFGDGFIEIPRIVRTDRTHVYFECPWDGSGHYATLALGGIHDARPIHCHHCQRTAWVMWITSPLKQEEASFRKILDKYRNLSELSAESAFRLWASEGVPIEIIEESCSEPRLFESLVLEHRERSRGAKVWGKV